MKNITQPLAVCGADLIASSVCSKADDWTQNLYLNVDAGGIFQQDADFTESGYPTTTATFNPGARIDFALGYKGTDSLAVELEPGFMWNSVDSLNGFSLGQFGESIDLYSIPVMANLVYSFPSKGGWTPYIGAGVGANVGIFDGSTPYGSVSDTGVTFAYQAEAGLKYALSDNATVGVAYKFFGTTDQTYSLSSYGTDNVTFGGVFIHGIFANFTLSF